MNKLVSCAHATHDMKGFSPSVGTTAASSDATGSVEAGSVWAASTASPVLGSGAGAATTGSVVVSGLVSLAAVPLGEVGRWRGGSMLISYPVFF